MANSPTVQSIRDVSNARAAFFHWTTGSAVITSLCGLAMPVALYRGHSLVKTVALGALVNGLVWGGVVGLGRWCRERIGQWKASETLQNTDQQLAPYLTLFPAAYEVVDIDPNKVTAAHLKGAWERSLVSGVDYKKINQTLESGAGPFAIASALMLGSALVGRLVQGAQPWQRLTAIIPFSVASVGSGLALWGIRRLCQADIDTGYVKHTLGRVIVAESSSSDPFREELSNFLGSRGIGIAPFYAGPVGRTTLERANERLAPYGLSVQQDSQRKVTFHSTRN